MKITRTSPARKQSNINHVCERARNFSGHTPHWSWNEQAEVQQLQANRHDFRIPRGLGTARKGVWDYSRNPDALQPEQGKIVAGLQSEIARLRMELKRAEASERITGISNRSERVAIID
jgi:hypothetical protein